MAQRLMPSSSRFKALQGASGKDLRQIDNEFRVIGPPGTGKTTYLCRQAERAIESIRRSQALQGDSGFEQGCGILFSSLTKAAANELRTRGVNVPEEAIGTLHAHAFRALGRPKLCVDNKSVAEWNKLYPQYRIQYRDKAPDQQDPDERDGESSGIFDEYLRLRAMLRPRELWSKNVLAFSTLYEAWKKVSGLRDYSDLIEDAYRECDTAPGNPSIIFVDEAQDHDRAELRLVRKWAKHCEKVIIVGDPDQNLYEWRGSEPEAFYESNIPPENTRVLSQSYRVPRVIHAAAMRMVGRIKNRVECQYESVDRDGEIDQLDESLDRRHVDYLLDHAIPRAKDGKTVMFLASCQYMLRPLCAELRERGVPFWNPFAPDRGELNPLHPGKGKSSCRRLLDYLRPSDEVYGDESSIWTPAELWSWVEVCSCDGWLARGAKEQIKKMASDPDFKDLPMQQHEVERLLKESWPQQLVDVDPMFLQSKLLTNRSGAMKYALAVLKKSGHKALLNPPGIVVGTIHSVKGGEADVVYLSPDLSTQAYEQYDSSEPDPVYRQMYVGMTRAKESLFLLRPSGKGGAVDW